LDTAVEMRGEGEADRYSPDVLIGYAGVSTDEQDLTAQRDALRALGVTPKRIYVDHGLTGTNRDRRGLREALAACRDDDTLVVTKLDRLARSLPDASDIVEGLPHQPPRQAQNWRRLGVEPHPPDRSAVQCPGHDR